jgi:hypothetical protein
MLRASQICGFLITCPVRSWRRQVVYRKMIHHAVVSAMSPSAAEALGCDTVRLCDLLPLDLWRRVAAGPDPADRTALRVASKVTLWL